MTYELFNLFLLAYLVAKVFSRLLAHLGVTVELYYARFADDSHTKIVFEKLGV